MLEQTTAYGFGTTIALPYDQAVARVREELANEGFGVLTEIDVAATFQKKLGVEFRPYVILGACNPPLAHRALTAERDIGLLLPCNVIVYEGDVPGTSVVAAMDPERALAMAEVNTIADVAKEVRAKLVRALDRVRATTSADPLASPAPAERGEA
jgi:uncharacterized protein (DUF302 family)